MSNTTQQQWQTYTDAEKAKLVPILSIHGYSLDDDNTQVHIQGERFLMHAVTTKSGKKIILFGNDVSTGKRVIIKASTDTAGKKELYHERTCRQRLNKIYFAYSSFHVPKELLFVEVAGMLVSIQEYIAQSTPFLKRPVKEQFHLALQAFKIQESAHATTHRHFKDISKTFGTRTSATYLQYFNDFATEIQKILPNNTTLHADIQKAAQALQKDAQCIEQYCGFLTHTDFVPHNFRIQEDTMYLLDFSSLLFGNKYEGWARFLNFMTLHNPQLEQYFMQYLVDNRSSEESQSLHLMRLYRLGEIIRYYAGTLSHSSGDLLQLNTARIHFWHMVLQATQTHTSITDQTRQDYTDLRDSLRSEGEQRRQQGLL